MNTSKDFTHYQLERQDLINNILLLSGGTEPELENKSISELIRIYYGAIGSQCPRCGYEIDVPIFNTVYESSNC